MNSLLHDNLSGIRQIKSFVREQKSTIASTKPAMHCGTRLWW